MRYIIEETLIPWLLSGSDSNSFIAEDKAELKQIISVLYETRNKMFNFKDDSVEFSGKMSGEGYVEAYLDRESPYSSWSVTWKAETVNLPQK